MTRFSLQFGQTQSGVTYQERSAVFGLCARGEKELALVRIAEGPGEGAYDLPGGAIQAGDDEADTLIRAFLDETGLTIWPNRVLGRAGQFWLDAGAPKNSLATFYEVELSAADAEPSLAGCSLVWLGPGEAMGKMRHESHAWAVLHWARAKKAALRDEKKR